MIFQADAGKVFGVLKDISSKLAIEIETVKPY